MATNEDLQSTDTTSGLERRRITVRFPRSATAEEKADWQARGGETAVLHVEIPGLIRWLLEMPVDEILARFDRPPSRVVADNLLGMAAGNSVADWMLSNTAPDPEAWTQIGVKQEGRDPVTGKTYFEHADDRLFPNYLRWCLESGRSRPVALQKFRSTIKDMAETLGHPVSDKQHPQQRTSGVQGLRLRAGSHSPSSGFEWGVESSESARRVDRTESGASVAQDSPSASTWVDA